MSAEKSSPRSRAERGPGWLATAAGALVLVVVGFALGLVAGAAFEAPGLVADHLAGRTTDVPLAAEEGGGLAGAEEAAARELGGAPLREGALAGGAVAPEAPRRPLGAPRAEASEVAEVSAGRASSARETPPVAAPPPVVPPAVRAGFAVQVGAFAERRAADALAGELRGLELPAYVVTEEGGHARHKVRVGPFAARHEAERLAARLKAEQRLPTWVLPQDAR